MKKLLIIGAGTEQIGVIKEAKKMGHFVVVSDFNNNAPGIAFADKFYEKSTTDGPGNKEIAQLEKVDGVLTVCSETAVPTVAFVAEALNLPSFSPKTALLATNKAKMRKALAANNVRVSPFIIAKSYEECTNFCTRNNGPWVFKPVDSSGQRGTNIIFNQKDIEKAFTEAQENSVSRDVLVDQFIQGPEIHVTMHVINKKVHFLAISDRITLDENNFGIAVRHICPSILDSKIETEIKKLCINGVKALELENGVATCELIINNSTPYVMELAVRVPGGYLRDVALLNSGVDLNKTTIWTALGDIKPISEVVTEPRYPANSVKFISAINLDSSISEINKTPNFAHLEKNEIQLINFHFTGHFNVPKLNSSVGRFGCIIGVGKDRADAVQNTEKVFNEIIIEGKKLTEYSNYSAYNVDFSSYLK